MLADVEHGETAAEEAAEPPVVAEPRIGRADLGYLEPREGVDGKLMFRCCGSCQHFVPEAYFTGALMGSRCAILGSAMSVSDDNYCHRYLPWASGVPCEDIVCMNAGQLRRGVPPAISPADAGYLWDTQTKKHCASCRFFDGPDECEMFEQLNEDAPDIFLLDTTVKPQAGCSLWRKVPEVGENGLV